MKCSGCYSWLLCIEPLPARFWGICETNAPGPPSGIHRVGRPQPAHESTAVCLYPAMTLPECSLIGSAAVYPCARQGQEARRRGCQRCGSGGVTSNFVRQLPSISYPPSRRLCTCCFLEKGSGSTSSPSCSAGNVAESYMIVAAHRRSS